MKTRFSKTIAIVSLLALLGAGCQPNVPKRTKNDNKQKTAEVRGFGKLPLLNAIANAPLGSEMARSSAPLGPSSIAPATPQPVTAGIALAEPAIAINDRTTIDKRFPIPPPFPRPLTIEYNLESPLPVLPTEENVFRFADPSYPKTSLSVLASATGLPGQAINNSQLQSFNFSWLDSDKMQWNFDAGNRNVNFWKQNDNFRIMADNAQENTPTKINDEEMIRIATDFLNKKGFGNIQHGPAFVEKSWGDPCPMAVKPAVEPSIAPEKLSVGSTGAGTSMIAPCWYQTNQATVIFNGQKDGRSISDLSGWPFRSIYITIDVKAKNVSSGNIWLNRETEVSKYPLISQAEAEKRLRAGGRNPIWPWYGNENDGVDLKVNLKKIELVWMRYDVWIENKSDVYLIPALSAEGEVEYSADRKEAYRTIVPLVADDAFESVTPPEPIPLPAESAPSAIQIAPELKR